MLQGIYALEDEASCHGVPEGFEQGQDRSGFHGKKDSNVRCIDRSTLQIIADRELQGQDVNIEMNTINATPTRRLRIRVGGIES